MIEQASVAFDEHVREFLNHPELDTRDTDFARDVWEAACKWQREALVSNESVDKQDIKDAADELYATGYNAAKLERDYDPRGCTAWQDVVDLVPGVPEDGMLLPVGWEGYYTRMGGTHWFWCRIVGYDEGCVILKTKSESLHRHKPCNLEFTTEKPKG